MSSLRKIGALYILFFSGGALFSQVYKDTAATVEERVESILKLMSSDEKFSYIGGYLGGYICSIPRLGLPEISMCDGPIGVRTSGQSTAYPAGISNAATFDKDLVYKLGQALGKDARARGIHILLGPGMNIYRAPMCGRNLEYFGEDPYLTGQMAVNFILGVQSKRVMATAKHFAGNNQEWDRMNVSSDIDERTLQEIYLPAFRSAVEDGKIGAVMSAYNLINGEHCTQSNHLNNEILKGQWGFDGILMSDWGATHDGINSAKGGLDLEMPSGTYMNSTTLQPAINNGTLTQSIIDDKVRRILRVIFRFGFYDKVQLDNTIPLDNPDNADVALNLARSGIVLLKNLDSILPLSLNHVKSLAVIGPNADQYVAGGGSSYTTPFHSITTLQGIKNITGDSITINYSVGIQSAMDIAEKSGFYSDSTMIVKGLKGDYFKNQTLSGTPDYTRIDTVVDFHWTDAPNINGFPADHFSIRWTGVIKPAQTSSYYFIVRVDDGCRLWVNNRLIVDQWHDQAATVYTDTIFLAAGVIYPIKLEYYENAGLAEITFGYLVEDPFIAAIKAATISDAAIVCVGFNSSLEGEGADRTFALPPYQDSLINAIANVNQNTIVILNAGGNVAMTNWLANIKGLLHAWYPGQEGGTALAEILFGITNPSGKLPASFEAKWEDNPTYNSYYDVNGSKHVAYSEGIFLGYRYYDTKKVDPLFPFGFGLSYTSFQYSNLQITSETKCDSIKYVVSFDIKNIGRVAGPEAAQVYVSDLVSSVQRPVKELKAFTKVMLKPGEKKSISVDLDEYAFAFYNTSSKSFYIENGDFNILVGSSSKDIRLTGKITIDNNHVITSAINEIKNQIEWIRIYPNPANNYLTIENNYQNNKNDFAEIYDINGRKIDYFPLISSQTIYDCSFLQNGFYIFKITSGNKIESKKLLILR